MFVKLIGYADAAGNADGGRFAEVIHIYRGVYHLKMPNGCRGAMFSIRHFSEPESEKGTW